jgi:hypothetical protein
MPPPAFPAQPFERCLKVLTRTLVFKRSHGQLELRRGVTVLGSELDERPLHG